MGNRRISQYHGKNRGGNDTDEDGPLHITGHQYAGQHETEQGHSRFRLRYATQGDEGSRVTDDKAGALEADEGDKETNAHADSHTQILRNSVDDSLTHMTDGQD